MISLFLQLFEVFFLIGMFTFGGGYAVIGMIQSEVVVARGWLTQSAFTDIVAISQMTPGPVGLNCSTYVGFEVLKEAGASGLTACLGSFTISLAIVMPSFLIMLCIVRFYTRFHKTQAFRTVMSALKPTVAGLIAASALAMMFSFRFGEGFSIVSDNFAGWKSWAVFLAAIIAYISGKAGPILILAASAIVGLLVF